MSGCYVCVQSHGSPAAGARRGKGPLGKVTVACGDLPPFNFRGLSGSCRSQVPKYLALHAILYPAPGTGTRTVNVQCGVRIRRSDPQITYDIPVVAIPLTGIASEQSRYGNIPLAGQDRRERIDGYCVVCTWKYIHHPRVFFHLPPTHVMMDDAI